MSETAEVQQTNKPKLSPELDALDSMIRLGMAEKKAPSEVMEAWDNFINVCAKWEAAGKEA